VKDKAKVAALHVKGSSLPNVAKINYYFCIERKTQPASGKTQTHVHFIMKQTTKYHTCRRKHRLNTE